MTGELGSSVAEHMTAALKSFQRMVWFLAAGEVLILAVASGLILYSGPLLAGPAGKPEPLLVALGWVIPWAACLGSWMLGKRWREVRGQSVIAPQELVQVLGGSANLSLFVAEGGAIMAIVFFLLTGQWFLVAVGFLPGFLLTLSAGPKGGTFSAVSR